MYSLFSRILPVCTDGMRQGVLLLEWKIKTSLFIGRKCYRDVAFVRFVVNIRRFICIVIKQTEKGQYWSCRYRFSGWNVNLDLQVFPVFSSSFCGLLFVHKPLHVDTLDLVVLHTGTEIFNWKDTILTCPYWKTLFQISRNFFPWESH